jgi:apolipoprotein N-acyltransferase
VRKRRLELLVWSFLLSLAFSPEYFGFLAWFSLVRPLSIISSLERRAALNAAFFFSFFFNLFSIWWIGMVTPPGMIAAVVLVGSYYTAVLMTFRKLYQLRPVYGFVAIPFLWTGMEYFRTLTEFAFPWSDLGYSQAYYSYILQFVSVTSVHGLSFLIVTVNVLLWQCFRKTLSPERRITALFASTGIIVALLAYGWIELPRIPIEGDFKLALMQGSVPLHEKWSEGNQYHSIDLYDSLTQAVADEDVNLYVWPETAAPCYLSIDRACRKRVGEVARKSAGYHLVGALAISYPEGVLRYHNSCFQINPGGWFEQSYDKVKLVPFSEQVPYQDQVPFMRKDFLRKYLTFIDRYDVQWWSDFRPGDSSVMFNLPEASYSVLICFETAFPEFVRRTILDGAQFVVGITNDTWWGRSVGLDQHARIFITRAVENRCWFARAANSGLTFIVDGYGRMHGELELYTVDALVGHVGLLDEYSFYTKHGDLIGRFSFLFTVSIMAILLAIWIVRKFMPAAKDSGS